MTQQFYLHCDKRGELTISTEYIDSNNLVFLSTEGLVKLRDECNKALRKVTEIPIAQWTAAGWVLPERNENTISLADFGKRLAKLEEKHNELVRDFAGTSNDVTGRCDGLDARIADLQACYGDNWHNDIPAASLDLTRRQAKKLIAKLQEFIQSGTLS